MPTSKQRREAARRHLERQLERRQQREAARRKAVLISSIAGAVAVVVVVVVLVVVIGHTGTKKTPVAAPSPSASASASAAAPVVKTTGPCGYTAVAAGNPDAKNVGFPPDPNPTPTGNRTMAIATNKGTISIALNGAVAPCNVQSLAYLAGKGLFNGSSCHRLVTSGIYVLQCGDPSGTGRGGPTYSVKDENTAKANYTTGVVALANSGANTNGSQFFIMYKDSTSLPKSYVPVGTVTAGMNIVQQVAAGGEDDSNGQGDGKPKVTLTFNSVTVTPGVTGSATLTTAPPSPAATSPAASSPAG